MNELELTVKYCAMMTIFRPQYQCFMVRVRVCITTMISKSKRQNADYSCRYAIISSSTISVVRSKDDRLQSYNCPCWNLYRLHCHDDD